MARLAMVLAFLCVMTHAGCNQASFSNEPSKKTRKPDPASENGTPLTPEGVPGAPSDCTAKSADDCRKQREEDQTKESFRNVDCTDKKFSECEEAVNKEKAKDEDIGSEIRVANCKDDDGKACEDLIAKVNNTNEIETSDGDDAKKDKDISLGESDKVSKFELDGNQAFDGIVNFCLNYETGKVTVTSGGGRFFAANVTFTVTRGSTPEKLVVHGQGGGQVPHWKKACGANPTTPGWAAVDPRRGTKNPPVMRVTKSGKSVCLYIDDGEGGCKGAVRITNFDYRLKYCSK